MNLSFLEWITVGIGAAHSTMRLVQQIEGEAPVRSGAQKREAVQGLAVAGVNLALQTTKGQSLSQGQAQAVGSMAGMASDIMVTLFNKTGRFQKSAEPGQAPKEEEKVLEGV